MRHHLYRSLVLVVAACGDDSADGVTSSASSSAPSSTTSTSQSASSTATTAVANSTTVSSGTGGSYEGVDPVAGTGPAELIEGGFSFTEGPCWFGSLGVLRFSDIPASRIHEVQGGTTITTWRQDSGRTNGIGVAPDGRLIACEGGNRQVTASNPDAPNFTVLAATYQNLRFNAPNDNIVHANGTIYFTDPDYGLPPNEHEIGFNGVYRIDPQGQVALVSDQLDLPNGIALSPDQLTLYVADNGSSEMVTFPVNADGSTGVGQVAFNTGSGPDGMAVDVAGNLYITTGAGVEVVRPDGSAWGTIPVAERPANCTFGDADGRTLYITARTSIYKVRLNVPGLP